MSTHGKSTLVRALTGMEPDRWEEERRRGLTIDLGFAWTTLPSGQDVAFVDVPGHERFLGNMLAGIGPAPVVCFVVAADEGWQAQSSDHRDAVAALGIEHGVVVISRTDRAPGQRSRDVLARTRESWPEPVCRTRPQSPCRPSTGTGLAELRARARRRAGRGCRRPPPRGGSGCGWTARSPSRGPAPWSPERWRPERSLGVTGCSCSATTVPARGGPRPAEPRHPLHVGGAGQPRGPEPARRFRRRHPPRRRAADPRCLAHHRRPGHPAAPPGVAYTDVPEQLMVHVGTAAVPARLRPFDADHARLVLDRPLPLVLGDRLVLRDPGSRSVLGGAQLLDADPPALRRRGDGAHWAERLAGMDPGRRRAGGGGSAAGRCRRAPAPARAAVRRTAHGAARRPGTGRLVGARSHPRGLAAAAAHAPSRSCRNAIPWPPGLSRGAARRPARPAR